MDAKHLLKQYTDLQIEIRELEKEIKKSEKFKVERDKVKGSSDVFPYTERSFTIEGYNIQDVDRLRQKRNILQERYDKCKDLKLGIEKFISTIPDSRTRRVFRYRYIDNLGWLQIAYRIGRTDESYPRKIVHDKYLEGLEDD